MSGYKLGRWAYETFWAAEYDLRGDTTAFDPFECQPISWQEAWQHTAEALISKGRGDDDK